MNKPQPILAIALSLAVILLFSKYFMPSAEDVNQVEPAQINSNEDVKKTSQTNSPPQINADVKKTSQDFSENNANDDDSQFNHLVNAPSEEIRVLENDYFKAEISSYGGAIKTWKLKKYQETTDKDSPQIDLFSAGEEGQAYGLKLNYREFDRKPFFKFSSDSSSDRIVLIWQSDKIKVTRTISIDLENPYLLSTKVDIKNISNQDISLQPNFTIRKKQTEDTGSSGILSFMMGPKNVYQPMYVKDDELQKITDLEKLENKQFEKGTINWTGLSDRYFLLGLISHQSSADTEINYGKNGDFLYTNLAYTSALVYPQENLTTVVSMYVGPKIRSQLEAVSHNLEKSIDYGFLEPVALGLLWLLFQFQKLVGNWGIAIILLTFLVKILLHPINKKSMTSMKAMQKIQPKLKEIREKYKDDRQKLNLEMMQLFKTHKVNPMGGCLPMVIQMPVYFALYQVLWNAIELYHTPFFGFYKDLAAPDPYFISPILLGVFMVLQQKFNPQSATMEPAQQKMMMIMPVIFTGVMAFFPFGLVLYILVNTVMSVIQQYMIHEDLSFIELIKKLTGQKKAA